MEFAYFSPINWNFIWQRPQSLALELARLGHKVLFVEPVRPLPKQLYFKQRMGTARVDEGITTVGLIPQLIGDMGPAGIWGIEDGISRVHTTRALRSMLSPESVIIVGAPNWAYRVNWDKLPHRMFCYDCIDFIEGMFSGAKSEAIHRMEDEMIRRSDAVLATHPALVEEIAGRGKSAHFIPNGASVEKFIDAPLPDAKWVRKLPRPIIGYAGAIAQWIDQSLIRAAAERHPEWSFVVIGPTLRKTSRTAFLGLPNVYRMGQISHDEVASYMRLFDVCTVPFKASAVADHTDPVKVYEYLACGKPVVSSHIPSLDGLSPMLYSVRSADEFINALERAAAENDPGLVQARVDYARANSWSVRAKQIVEVVNDTVKV